MISKNEINNLFNDKILRAESIINYSFKDKNLILLALTHSSFTLDFLNNNERLEFLGDAVLEIVVSSKLYELFPEKSEGALTKLRSLIVKGTNLKEIAENLGIQDCIVLGKTEEVTGGRKKSSILADALEALFAAVYIDGGFMQAQKTILNIMEDSINTSNHKKNIFDYKSELQELLQRKGNTFIKYTVIKEEGPPHNKIFHSRVEIDGKIHGTGSGKNKKEAEQAAAHMAYKNEKNKKSLKYKSGGENVLQKD